MNNMYKGFNGKPLVKNNSLSNVANAQLSAKNSQAKLKAEQNIPETYESVFQKAMGDLNSLLSESTLSEEKFQSCIENLVKASKLNEEELSPYYYLSFILNMCGEKEEAIKYFEIVQAVDPNFDGLESLYEEIYDVYIAEEGEEPSPDEEADEIYNIIGDLKLA
ncbi:MAG: hypothetical protein U0457_06985 [Candidatus Sericytochromatia bacterium]